MTKVGSLTVVLLAGVATVTIAAEAPDAQALVAASIAYHDPHDRWGTRPLRLELHETRPDGPTRSTALRLGHPGAFLLERKEGETLIRGRLVDGQCAWTLNGSSEISAEEVRTHRLTCERLQLLRNYYDYLWGLPMKLRDPGTRIDPLVERATFGEHDAWALRVTYDPDVGEDTWVLYFDRHTSALVGYRFFHDEAKRDGEYILLEGTTAGADLRLPARRSWYTHQGDEYLGTDELVSLTAE